MSAKTITINGEEFPSSILNAPKIPFLKPKKDLNFPMLSEEVEDLLCNKENIFKGNFQKCSLNIKEKDSKSPKRKILKYIKRMSSNTLHDSNPHSRDESGEICKNEEEKIIFFPDLKI